MFLLDCWDLGLCFGRSAAGNPAAMRRPEAGAFKLCAGNSDQQRVASGFASFAPHKSLLRIKLLIVSSR
jgi:hypothetical protein